MDLLVPDPAAPEHVFIEANERPGLANHEPQPTAERFVDLLFPGHGAAGSLERRRLRIGQPRPAPARPIDMAYVQEVLVDLLRTPSPTGRTDAVMQYVGERLLDLGLDLTVTRRGAAQRDHAGRRSRAPTGRSSCTPTRSAAWSSG